LQYCSLHQCHAPFVFLTLLIPLAQSIYTKIYF
jgi:hypothetical protein